MNATLLKHKNEHKSLQNFHWHRYQRIRGAIAVVEVSEVHQASKAATAAAAEEVTAGGKLTLLPSRPRKAESFNSALIHGVRYS
ncbi:hypothetical protein Naga_101306g1 [Nannochloropsis gaditana]|uniref:Uncharacterized protein n=1 Tax=Nannochloropsis gaditana TaxID=72520 RepID=W7T0V6_9STRA|nr:hypothetical protein Naga_101306g1 [Nannochloropsis gaditana]